MQDKVGYVNKVNRPEEPSSDISLCLPLDSHERSKQNPFNQPITEVAEPWQKSPNYTSEGAWHSQWPLGRPGFIDVGHSYE